MRRIHLNILDTLDEYMRLLLKHLTAMQYNEKIRWIKQNKMEILLALYNAIILSDETTLYLWRKQINEILFLQDLLNTNKINYVFVKTIFLIPYLHVDIDIMTDKIEISKVISVLKKNGYYINRVPASQTIELRRGDISIELHSDIKVLGLLQLTFKQIGEPVEISIDVYNKLLNNVIYWKSPRLLIHHVLKLLNILDHKIITVADMLELKILSDILSIDNAFFMENELYKYPKVATFSEIALIVRTLNSYKKIVELKPDVLSFIKDFAYYFKIRMKMI